MIVRIQKLGNRLWVRIPKSISQKSRMYEGAEREICATGRQIILMPIEVPTLRELLRKVKRTHRPELADWGKPVGGEAW